MVKHSSQKRRGIRKVLPRHSFRVPDGTVGRLASMFSKQLDLLPALAENLWNRLRHADPKFCLIVFDFDPETDRAELASFWKRCIHYMFFTIHTILMCYRMSVTIERFGNGQLDILTYMCACEFIVHCLGACGFIACTWLAGPLCQLLNSWKSMEMILQGEAGRRKSLLFDDKTVSIQMLCVLTMVIVGGINASMLSLVGEVPTSVLPTLTRMGWLDLPDTFPRILWSVLFLPLQSLTLFPSLILVGILGISGVLGLGMFKVYAENVRKRTVSNVADWKKVYRHYRVMQVYNGILANWWTYMSSPTICTLSCVVILLLYVTLRPSNLPFLIYVWFPIVAVICQVTVSWIIYESVTVKRSMGEIAGNLDSCRYSLSFLNMDSRTRAIMTRQVKSFRPATIMIGEFTETSLDLPVNLWDEIMNQLMFLLSL